MTDRRRRQRAAPSASSSSTRSSGSAASSYEDVPLPSIDLSNLTRDQQALFAYYRDRLLKVEDERTHFISRIDEVTGRSDEYRRLRDELTRYQLRVDTLQAQLSDQAVAVSEARNKYVSSELNNNKLRVTEEEDRKRIDHLLALTVPVTQQVVYFRDARPEKITRNSIVDKPHDATHAGKPIVAKENSTIEHSKTTATRPFPANSRILRTVYLPNESVETLRQQVSEAEALTSAQRTAFDAEVIALRNDRTVREKQHAEELKAARDQLLDSQVAYDKVRDMNIQTTKDYLALRHSSQVKERKLNERIAELISANKQHKATIQQILDQNHIARSSKNQTQSLHNDIQTTERTNKTSRRRPVTSFSSSMSSISSLHSLDDSHDNINNTSHTAEHASSSLSSELDKERHYSRRCEEEVAMMKSQYASTQVLYEKRIDHLQQKYDSLHREYINITERRDLEKNGYEAEMKTLRERVRRVENHYKHMHQRMIEQIRTAAEDARGDDEYDDEEDHLGSGSGRSGNIEISNVINVGHDQRMRSSSVSDGFDERELSDLNDEIITVRNDVNEAEYRIRIHRQRSDV